MKILTAPIALQELKENYFGCFPTMIKAVVDCERGQMAVDADMHSDLETLLLENGSNNHELWGINLHPLESGENFLEFDSLINIRPSQDNRTLSVEDAGRREKIKRIVKYWIPDAEIS